MKTKPVRLKRFDRPYVVAVRLAFIEGTTRKTHSNFIRRMRGSLRSQGLIAVMSRNWIVCMPVADKDIEQARVDLATWLVDQSELEGFITYFPVPATRVIDQRDAFEDLTPGWKVRPNDVDTPMAKPLLATLCGHAITQALVDLRVTQPLGAMQ